MYAGTELEPYMAAIREQVCSRCVERPDGGPPCFPLGKRCGIEMNLGQLVEAVRGVDSPVMDPYIGAFHDVVCEHCPNRSTSQCPCALDALLLLAVTVVAGVQAHKGLDGIAVPPNVVDCNTVGAAKQRNMFVQPRFGASYRSLGCGVVLVRSF